MGKKFGKICEKYQILAKFKEKKNENKVLLLSVIIGQWFS